MQYKTIILNLIRQNPREHQALVRTKQLGVTVDARATELRERHLDYLKMLTEQDSAAGEAALTQQALEMALSEMLERHPDGSNELGVA